jgi:hypothetical protein
MLARGMRLRERRQIRVDLCDSRRESARNQGPPHQLWKGPVPLQDSLSTITSGLQSSNTRTVAKNTAVSTL